MTVPWPAIGGVGLLGGMTVAYGVFAPRSSLFGTVICRGPRAGSRVALTFDDGPHPAMTPSVLDVLRDLSVPAAFFVIGMNAERYPDVLERVNTEGHLIGNHTYEHARLAAFRGYGYWREEVGRANEAIASIVARRPAFFRPPMGIKTPRIAKAVRGAGMRMVTWDRRAFDGVPVQPHKVVRNLTHWPRAGNILVMHDGAEPGRGRDGRATLEALPKVIERVRSRGLEFERLDRLIGVEGYLPDDLGRRRLTQPTTM